MKITNHLHLNRLIDFDYKFKLKSHFLKVKMKNSSQKQNLTEIQIFKNSYHIDFHILLYEK